MQEKQKLAEAEYFFTEMASEPSRQAFIYKLSAFLSAARSVLQYANKEAAQKTGGQEWYEATVKDRPTIRFFRDKRNISIHGHPVIPAKETQVDMASELHLSGSLDIVVRDKDGNVREARSYKNAPTTEKPGITGVTVTEKYVFTDWPGDEDLIEASSNYLKELREVVEDGIQKKFITG